jgi:6-phosphofructokinase 2
MTPIVTLTLNPTVDLSSVAERVRPIHKVRTHDDRFDPGGGGINVARVVVELGGNAEALALAGGTTGSLLDELLEREGVPRRLIATAGQTRISHIIFERESGLEYRFVPSGEAPSAEELERLVEAAGQVECRYFVASGSVPTGAPPDILARIGRLAAERGAWFVLDSSGVGLTATLGRAPVHLVKPSLSELETIAGRELKEPSAQEEVAREIVQAGHAEMVAVTLGADGAVLATRDRILRKATPKVETRSAVGAGDSFLAAMILALWHGEPPEQAFVAGIAAGAAAVLTPGTRLVRRADYERIREKLRRAG